ncbi:bifunctional 2-polyprenyl-6-hydroxyphenol methylase/3-demethylubiquinol 3-O-methyltransferase UbiG [Mycobacterium sp. 1274761.0]|uniref:class I SAM-dependent methyltransferase n=1 Tax=Mycobacterium sp. 1274761.0 TaxID=1834077 RepID=UPI0007FD2C03|nr:class I SAM-dependent methyltransferase [Mycobacterium sp. 1274761.0]OBK74422.1 SAM-dependent methyltransferase [Mycobacterium sp. 1274761.0]
MSQKSAIKHVGSWEDDDAILSSAIKRLDGPLEILEAGCGRRWSLDLDGVDYRLTGIDLDADALNSRITIEGDLDEAIVADLSVAGTIETGRYDVIFSSYVLEHIDDAETALDNMINGLKPGGLLLLRIPDRDSVQGWTARNTPFSVHVAYYRHVVGYRDAGKPGHAPYPTFHAPVVSRKGIRDFCEQRGCTVLEEFGHTAYIQGNGAKTRLIRAYVRGVSALSSGALAWQHNNLTFIIRKS